MPPRWLWTALALGSSVLRAQSVEPEVFTSLDKAFYARPDPNGTIAAADAALIGDPASADKLLAAAAARDALLRFSASLPLYTRGIGAFPDDIRFLRYRGHRFISIRRFDAALADLKAAAQRVPDSFDVSYHLALTYYLRRDYNHALREYQRCLQLGGGKGRSSALPLGWRTCRELDQNARAALLEWAYRAATRAGKPDVAAALVGEVTAEWQVTENRSYLESLLLHKGVRTEADLSAGAGQDGISATLGYAIGFWHATNGRSTQACESWRRVVAGEEWAAFGFIAAEADLARGICGAPGKGK